MRCGMEGLAHIDQSLLAGHEARVGSGADASSGLAGIFAALQREYTEIT
jgi:hypothetical protein